MKYPWHCAFEIHVDGGKNITHLTKNVSPIVIFHSNCVDFFSDNVLPTAWLLQIMIRKQCVFILYVCRFNEYDIYLNLASKRLSIWTLEFPTASWKGLSLTNIPDFYHRYHYLYGLLSDFLHKGTEQIKIKNKF